MGIANVVANREEVVGWGEPKKLKSVVTYDDGMSPVIDKALINRLKLETTQGSTIPHGWR